MIRLKAVYLSDDELRDILSSEGVAKRISNKLYKTLRSSEYSNIFEG